MSDPEQGSDPEHDVRAEAIAWLSALRSSENSEQYQAFEDWYAADPIHADIYDDVVANWETMGLAAQTPAAKASARQTTSIDGRSKVKWAIAAVAVLVLTLVSGMGFTNPGVVPPDRAVRTEIASQTGEIRTVTLDDGSRLTLDTGTAVTVAYRAGERQLTLKRGRARFDVAHDPKRPFVVVAGSGTIIAHGTLFDVSLKEAGVTVALLRGSVEVKSGVASPAARTVRGRLLVPGQQVILSRRLPVAEATTLSDAETRWPTGILSFEDVSLSELALAVNRYNSVQIRFSDPAVAALRFTGSVAARDAGGLARMLSASFNLDLTQGENGSLILGTRTGGKKVPG